MSSAVLPSLTRAVGPGATAGGPEAAPAAELLLDRSAAQSLPLKIVRPLRRCSPPGLLRGIDRYPGRYLPPALEGLVMALIAFQGLSLHHVLVTPPEASPRDGAAPPPRPGSTAILSTFDPFFRGSGGTTTPRIASELTLHGLREDRRGGGSAIISWSDGVQRNVGVGEEISPGVVLKAVASGHAVIFRHGIDERLAFKDVSSPRSAVAPPPGGGVATRPLSLTEPPVAEVKPLVTPPDLGSAPGATINFADPSTLPEALRNPPPVAGDRPRG